MNLTTSPLFERLDPHPSILLAGAGGGFDIYAGLPLYFALRAQGKDVTLANLSFTQLDATTNADWLTPEIVEVTPETDGPQGYFPERHLAMFLEERGEPGRVYATKKSGARLLERAYRALHARHGFDAVVLVDGGTDSLMRGDEPGLGTPAEDMASVAAWRNLAAEVPEQLLVCLGFGVDTFHGVCHHYVLEAIAELTASGDFLGTIACLPGMPEVEAYREAVAFAHARMSGRHSIVNASILDAVRGAFGDVHATKRTQGSTLYINPLMAILFAFDLGGVAARVRYLEELRRTVYFRDVVLLIEGYRSGVARELKPWRDMEM